jgi:hypothetical protein
MQPSKAIIVQLHRCRTPWKFGPCWRVQKALDDAGIDYAIVPGPWRPKHRAAVIAGTGQTLYPAIRFDDGTWYREESKDMARLIRYGSLGMRSRRSRVDTGPFERDPEEQAHDQVRHTAT